MLIEDWWTVASGRPESSDSGWYFTGRRSLSRRMVEFLNAMPTDDAPHVAVVTGPAGCGKSAALARLVVLADPAVRRDERLMATVLGADLTLPLPGPIDVALDARECTTAELLRALSAFLPGEHHDVGPTAAVHAAVSLLGRQVTIVLDNLDQAEQPAQVIEDVIVPLAAVSGLARLLVVTRGITGIAGAAKGIPELLGAALGRESVLQISADDPEDFADGIFEYVLALLANARTSPYAGRRDAAIPVAMEIYNVAFPSYHAAQQAALVARRSAEAQDPDDESWLSGLAEPLLHRYAADVAAVAASYAIDSAALLAVLRASTLAFGDGVPADDIWTTMADAVAGTDLPHAATVVHQAMHSRLGGYLTCVISDGTPYVAHANITLDTVLRATPGRLCPYLSDLAGSEAAVLDPPEIVQARITDAFINRLVQDGLVHRDLPAARELQATWEDDLTWYQGIAFDPTASYRNRFSAASKLIELGDRDSAVGAVSSIVTDPAHDLSQRCWAAWHLWDWGFLPEAITAYEALARDPQIEDANGIREAIREIGSGRKADFPRPFPPGMGKVLAPPPHLPGLFMPPPPPRPL